MIALVSFVILSYLIGSIPTSFIIAKLKGGIDIRNHGSGNVGATNVLRTSGKAAAIIALTGDILKGVIPVLLIAPILNRFVDMNYESIRILLGFSAICGHIWPVFLHFKGGKGVATSCGVLLLLCPKAFGIAVLVWLITVILARYVSLGSILACISLPISTAILGSSIQMVLFTITLCFISSYKHKSNIIRLINNEEPRINQKTSS